MAISKVLCAGLLLLGAQFAWAEEPGQASSVMFEQAKDHGHLTATPAGAADQATERCAELARQMEALKGKPQRRYAVAQQYEAECRR